MFEIFPAIDVRGGRAVRLVQGDYDRETVYGDDPVAIAESFVAGGARWIHVVDLDAARSGDPVNRPVVRAIARAVGTTAAIQAGGGVRRLQDVEALAGAGVTRVVMGSAALEDPSLVERASEIAAVAVGLDHRDGDVAVHGWTHGSGVRVAEALSRYPTAAAFVVTNIARDGMLLGPDVDGLSSIAAIAPAPVIASGGVSSLDDIAALRAIAGVAGVITGKAIYEGRFTVAEAVAVAGTLEAGS
jgi:phosphoribosylformimino-5-aminoimidazole carboxamide ribotide isomerase